MYLLLVFKFCLSACTQTPPTVVEHGGMLFDWARYIRDIHWADAVIGNQRTDFTFTLTNVRWVPISRPCFSASCDSSEDLLVKLAARPVSHQQQTVILPNYLFRSGSKPAISLVLILKETLSTLISQPPSGSPRRLCNRSHQILQDGNRSVLLPSCLRNVHSNMYQKRPSIRTSWNQ